MPEIFDEILKVIEVASYAVLAITAIFGAWFAKVGWQKEMQGRKKNDLASELLEHTCQIQSNIAELRNPTFHITKILEAGKAKGVVPNTETTENIIGTLDDHLGNKVLYRIKSDEMILGRISSQLEKLQSLIIKSKIFWQDELVSDFEMLFAELDTLRGAHILKLFVGPEQSAEEQEPNKDIADDKKAENKLAYEGFFSEHGFHIDDVIVTPKGEDKFGERLAEIFANIEAKLRKKIKS